MIKFLDLKAQFSEIASEIREAIECVIADTAFISGKYAHAFEEEFGNYQGSDFCVGVGNGTDALEIAIEALGLPKGSGIIVPANSFIASSEAVTRAGHRVVFCDCDPKNLTLSIEDLRDKITSETSAVMPVHLYGHPCDMGAIRDLSNRHGLKIIEDCAQAHGAEFEGQKVGTLGDVATFSFYPGKNLGAYGDAGAVLTDDSDLARRIRMIANHGRVEKYNHEFEGRNSRMDGIQAAILSVKLRHLDRWLDARRTVASIYREELADCPGVTLPIEESWARHVYHLFVIRTPARDQLRDSLTAAEIQTGIHYPMALPKLEAYRYLDLASADLAANALDSQVLSLPMGEHLDAGEARKVAAAVRSFAEEESNWSRRSG